MSKPTQKTKPQKVEIIPTLSVGASKKIGAVNAP
jgi:hypothetical protein